MSEFYLVRHGQASFGAKNYDKLSELGHRQALWLGQYFRERGIDFSHLYRGDMVRHRETAEGISSGLGTAPSVNINAGFNEFDFENVGQSYLSVHPEKSLAKDAQPTDFYRLLKLAMLAWSQNELPETTLRETWQQFQSRVKDALLSVCEQGGEQPIVIVSSGGAISMLMSLVLGLESKQVIELNMQIRNTSVSHFYFSHNTVRLASFNNVPHLDRSDRQSAITFS